MSSVIRQIEAGARTLGVALLTLWGSACASSCTRHEGRAWCGRAGCGHVGCGWRRTAAPLATLIDRLGPAAEEDLGAGSGVDPAVLARWLFAALWLALLVEWASRRTRGAR